MCDCPLVLNLTDPAKTTYCRHKHQPNSMGSLLWNPNLGIPRENWRAKFLWNFLESNPNWGVSHHYKPQASSTGLTQTMHTTAPPGRAQWGVCWLLVLRKRQNKVCKGTTRSWSLWIPSNSPDPTAAATNHIRCTGTSGRVTKEMGHATILLSPAGHPQYQDKHVDHYVTTTQKCLGTCNWLTD